MGTWGIQFCDEKQPEVIGSSHGLPIQLRLWSPSPKPSGPPSSWIHWQGLGPLSAALPQPPAVRYSAQRWPDAVHCALELSQPARSPRTGALSTRGAAWRCIAQQWWQRERHSDQCNSRQGTASASQQNWIEVDFTLVCLDPYKVRLKPRVSYQSFLKKVV